MRLIFLIMVMLLAGTSMAQSKRKKKKQEVQNNPTSVDPAYNQKYQEPRQARRYSKGPTYNAEKIFYERMDAHAKVIRKNEKMLAKPQYSDPSYFGHKRPPKKHRAGKIRYCKECGIRH